MERQDAWRTRRSQKYGINVLGVKENGKMDPAISASDKLKDAQTLMVLGKFKDLKKCFRI